MECGAGGAVATDRSSVPLRTTTCVNLCEGITYGRRTGARISAVLTACARRALPAVRARGAGVATRVLFVCCRRVCDMASTFLFSFFSVSRTFVHRCRSPGTRRGPAGVRGNRGKSTMSVRDVSSIVRGRQGPRAENHGRSAARRGMPRSARRRRAARARNGQRTRADPKAQSRTPHRERRRYAGPRERPGANGMGRVRGRLVDDREPADRFPFAWGIGCHGSVRTAERLAARLASPIDVTYRAVSSWARHEL